MAQLLDIQRVAIGPSTFSARVRVAEGAPLNTSENVEATARVYWLMPEIADHVCVAAGGETFRDVMGQTPLAHLMEHVALELLARTNMAGDLSSARTRATDVDRVYEIELACPDDVLVASALSSAGWILQWAFGSADEDAKPNVDAIVAGIVNLTANAYQMEGNEAPMPGTARTVEAEAVAARVEEGESRTSTASEPRVAVAEAAEDAAADAAFEAEELAEEAAEDDELEDALAGLDVVVGGEADLEEEAAPAARATRRFPRSVELGDEVGFMDATLFEKSDDELA